MAATRTVEVSPRLTARRQKTLDNLLDAAVTMFAERGVMGATVEQICDAAGYTRGAFYSNFESKDDLCVAVLEHVCARHTAVLDQALRQRPDEQADADAFIEQVVSFFVDMQTTDTNTAIALVELRLHSVRNPDFAPSYERFGEALFEHYGELIATALARFGRTLRVPPPDAVVIIKGIFEDHTLLMAAGKSNREVLTSRLVRTLRALID